METRNSSGEAYTLGATHVVNAAGLACDRVAELAGLDVDALGYRLRLCKATETAGPGEPFADFVIEEASANGAPGLVNLIGIESPGLTASAAIADRVLALLS